MTDHVSIDSSKYPGLVGMGGLAACACQNDDRTQPGMAGYGLGGTIENVGAFTSQDTGRAGIPGRGYGLGSVVSAGPGAWIDTSTGRQVIPGPDGTWVPIGGSLASGVPGSEPSTVDWILGGAQTVVKDPMVGALATMGLSRLVPGMGPSAPPPPPPPPQGPSFGTVALIALGLAGGAYVYSKSK